MSIYLCIDIDGYIPLSVLKGGKIRSYIVEGITRAEEGSMMFGQGGTMVEVLS